MRQRKDASLDISGFRSPPGLSAFASDKGAHHRASHRLRSEQGSDSDVVIEVGRSPGHAESTESFDLSPLNWWVVPDVYSHS